MNTYDAPTDRELECCEVGDWLADDGLSSGTWHNRFVAAVARELLAARHKLREFGLVWDGDNYKFDGKDI